MHRLCVTAPTTRCIIYHPCMTAGFHKKSCYGKGNAEKNNVYILCFFFLVVFLFWRLSREKKTWRIHYQTSSILKTKKRGGVRNIMHADQWQDHWITARPPAHCLHWHHIRTVCWAEIYPPSGTRTELVPHRLYLWIFRSATDIHIGFVKGGAGHVSTCTAEWPAQLAPYVVDCVAGSEPRRGDMARHDIDMVSGAMPWAELTKLSCHSFHSPAGATWCLRHARSAFGAPKRLWEKLNSQAASSAGTVGQPSSHQMSVKELFPWT